VRTYNVDQTKNLRSLNPEGEFVSGDGDIMVFVIMVFVIMVLVIMVVMVITVMVTVEWLWWWWWLWESPHVMLVTIVIMMMVLMMVVIEASKSVPSSMFNLFPFLYFVNISFRYWQSDIY
jgi:energy-coupling factor transporter transmembrane protein EcfT